MSLHRIVSLSSPLVGGSTQRRRRRQQLMSFLISSLPFVLNNNDEQPPPWLVHQLRHRDWQASKQPNRQINHSGATSECDIISWRRGSSLGAKWLRLELMVFTEVNAGEDEANERQLGRRLVVQCIAIASQTGMGQEGVWGRRELPKHTNNDSWYFLEVAKRTLGFPSVI